jgi:hypothetical protein
VDRLETDENREHARRVLEQAGVLRRAADLDLLLFFARHPRTLLTSEQIATFLGYEISQIAESLDLLLETGIVTRTQNPSHAARLYVFAPSHGSDRWLPTLLQLAGSRKGRLALLTELSERQSRDSASPSASRGATTRTSRPRPRLVREMPDATPGTKAG